MLPHRGPACNPLNRSAWISFLLPMQQAGMPFATVQTVSNWHLRVDVNHIPSSGYGPVPRYRKIAPLGYCTNVTSPLLRAPSQLDSLVLRRKQAKTGGFEPDERHEQFFPSRIERRHKFSGPHFSGFGRLRGAKCRAFKASGYGYREKSKGPVGLRSLQIGRKWRFRRVRPFQGACPAFYPRRRRLRRRQCAGQWSTPRSSAPPPRFDLCSRSRSQP